MDDTQRSSYNKFGTDGLDFDPRNDEVKLFSNLLLKYLIWTIVVYVLTLRTAVQSSRMWISIIGLGMLLTEVYMLFTEQPFPGWVAHVAEFEVIQMLQILYATMIGVLCVLAEYEHIDVDMMTVLTMTEMARGYRVSITLKIVPRVHRNTMLLLDNEDYRPETFPLW
jgi:hypothetical protein